jgi:hypothetical protein
MEFGEQGIADRILREASVEVPGEDIADLLGILSWSGNEIVAGIYRDADQWLREDIDERRVYVALHLEAFPFRTYAEMREVLSKIAEARPSLRVRCMDLIEKRARSIESRHES